MTRLRHMSDFNSSRFGSRLNAETHLETSARILTTSEVSHELREKV